MPMAAKQLLISLSIVLLSSCTLLQTEQAIENLQPSRFAEVSEVINENLANLGVPNVKPVVAVYPTAFTDQTGQRRSNSTYASFSTAVTQAPYTLLIKALKDTSNGNFFEVVRSITFLYYKK